LTEYSSVRVLRQDQAGVSAARNLGIQTSASEWIAFLDSDDTWMPRKLARQIEALEREPEYPLCHTGEIWIRNGCRVNPMKKHAKAGGWIFRNCLPLCVISPSSAMIRRKLLMDLGGFDPSLPACEDYDLWLRICSRHPVLFLPEPLITKVGGHEDQLSRKHWGMDRFRVRALEKLLGDASLQLSKEDRKAAAETLIAKLEVLENGARKRGKAEAAMDYRQRRGRAGALLSGSGLP
jgi:glycosyltransferase involved in cell wall biosynthesis